MPLRHHASSHQYLTDTFLHQQLTHTFLSHSPSLHYQQNHAHSARCRIGQSKLSKTPQRFLYWHYTEIMKHLFSHEKCTCSNPCCDGQSAEISVDARFFLLCQFAAKSYSGLYLLAYPSTHPLFRHRRPF